MIALVTSAAARNADTDLPLLCGAMPEAVVVDWDDRLVDWSQFDTVVIRSPWDYHRRRAEFLRWADAVAKVTRLWNPVDIVRWNTDKRYLGELATAGLAVAPTEFCVDVDQIASLARTGGFDGDVIVKPSVGASASGVRRFEHEPSAAAAHARDLIGRDHVAMVQPYLAAIEQHGETGLVYLAGTFSHAFRRRVVLPVPVVGHTRANQAADVPGDETSSARRASPAERVLADAVVDWLPEVAYARVDLLPTEFGPVVLEVEVTEPSLFLHLDDDAPARAAAAFRSL